MKQNKIITRGLNGLSNQGNLSFHLGGVECFCFVYFSKKQDIRKVTMLGSFLTDYCDRLDRPNDLFDHVRPIEISFIPDCISRITFSGRVDLTFDIASRASLSFLRIYPFEIIDVCKLSLQRQFHLASDKKITKIVFFSSSEVSDNPLGVAVFSSMISSFGIRFGRLKKPSGKIDFSENIKPILNYSQAC